nr:unnamed protein product [Callosobruchus analis]
MEILQDNSVCLSSDGEDVRKTLPLDSSIPKNEINVIESLGGQEHDDIEQHVSTEISAAEEEGFWSYSSVPKDEVLDIKEETCHEQGHTCPDESVEDTIDEETNHNEAPTEYGVGVASDTEDQINTIIPDVIETKTERVDADQQSLMITSVDKATVQQCEEIGVDFRDTNGPTEDTNLSSRSSLDYDNKILPGYFARAEITTDKVMEDVNVVTECPKKIYDNGEIDDKNTDSNYSAETSDNIKEIITKLGNESHIVTSSNAHASDSADKKNTVEAPMLNSEKLEGQDKYLTVDTDLVKETAKLNTELSEESGDHSSSTCIDAEQAEKKAHVKTLTEPQFGRRSFDHDEKILPGYLSRPETPEDEEDHSISICFKKVSEDQTMHEGQPLAKNFHISVAEALHKTEEKVEDRQEVTVCEEKETNNSAALIEDRIETSNHTRPRSRTSFNYDEKILPGYFSRPDTSADEIVGESLENERFSNMLDLLSGVEAMEDKLLEKNEDDKSSVVGDNTEDSNIGVVKASEDEKCCILTDKTKDSNISDVKTREDDVLEKNQDDKSFAVTDKTDDLNIGDVNAVEDKPIEKDEEDKSSAVTDKTEDLNIDDVKTREDEKSCVVTDKTEDLNISDVRTKEDDVLEKNQDDKSFAVTDKTDDLNIGDVNAVEDKPIEKDEEDKSSAFTDKTEDLNIDDVKTREDKKSCVVTDKTEDLNISDVRTKEDEVLEKNQDDKSSAVTDKTEYLNVNDVRTKEDEVLEKDNNAKSFVLTDTTEDLNIGDVNAVEDKLIEKDEDEKSSAVADKTKDLNIGDVKAREDEKSCVVTDKTKDLNISDVRTKEDEVLQKNQDDKSFAVTDKTEDLNIGDVNTVQDKPTEKDEDDKSSAVAYKTEDLNIGDVKAMEHELLEKDENERCSDKDKTEQLNIDIIKQGQESDIHNDRFLKKSVSTENKLITVQTSKMIKSEPNEAKESDSVEEEKT